MKICDVCGTANFKENIYCIHCGCKISMENICPNCGALNEDSDHICSNCNCPLVPVTIDSFDSLFSDFNKQSVANASLSLANYHNILKSIFKKADFFEIKGDTPKNKILSLAGTFAVCETKSRGHEYGYNFGNRLYYDDRLDESLQIAAIIHELAHCLLFYIFQSLLCEILQVKSNDYINSFIWFFLTSGEIEIMNEYCAHTVEGRFIPFGYQNYGSFNSLVEESKLPNELISFAIILGNNFANEIIVFLEKYIDADLRKEIKIQYKKDLKNPQYDSIKLETSECLDLNLKNQKVLELLSFYFNEASEESNRKDLEYIKEGLENY